MKKLLLASLFSLSVFAVTGCPTSTTSGGCEALLKCYLDKVPADQKEALQKAYDSIKGLPADKQKTVCDQWKAAAEAAGCKQ